MSAHALPLSVLVRVSAAIERALNDDRAHRVTLPKDTFMDLIRAQGELSTALESIARAVPVAVEGSTS